MVSIMCNNKDCCKLSLYSYLDKKTNEVICCECNKSIIGVSDFIKRSFVGEAVSKNPSDVDVKESFSVTCNKCKRLSRPILKADNEFYCSKCDYKFTLPKPFEMVLRDQLGKDKARR